MRVWLALLLLEQKGLPPFFHDIYFPPWLVALWGANNQNACFNWFQRHGARSPRIRRLMCGPFAGLLNI
jgi:hypothetical protein